MKSDLDILLYMRYSAIIYLSSSLAVSHLSFQALLKSYLSFPVLLPSLLVLHAFLPIPALVSYPCPVPAPPGVCMQEKAEFLLALRVDREVECVIVPRCWNPCEGCGCIVFLVWVRVPCRGMWPVRRSDVGGTR